MKSSTTTHLEPNDKAKLVELCQKAGIPLSQFIELIVKAFLRDNVIDGVAYLSEKPPSEKEMELEKALNAAYQYLVELKHNLFPDDDKFDQFCTYLENEVKKLIEKFPKSKKPKEGS